MSLPLSHAIGTELMLGIAYEHDASFAARCSKEQRGDSVIGPGLALCSPRAASEGKGRALVSRTSSVRASRRRRSGASVPEPACGCRPLLTVPARDARPLTCHNDAHSSRARRVSTWRCRESNPRSTHCASREPDAALRAPLSDLLSAEPNLIEPSQSRRGYKCGGASRRREASAT